MTSTNITATVSKVDEDGTITTVYCHNDGEPEKLGKLLFNEYSDIEKLDRLIVLGSYSRIYGEIKNYHRDMNQIWNDVKPQIHNGFEEAVKEFACQEYNYFFVDGEWLVSNFIRVRKPLIDFL